MSQSRAGSLIETLGNVGSGLIISTAMNAYFLPMIDIHPSHSQNVAMTAAYTLVSIIRSYSFRRLFNWYSARKSKSGHK